MTTIRVLERFARAPRPAVAPKCEICAQPLAERHPHVVDRDEQRLLCACHACRLLFADRADGRYRAVGRRARRVPDGVIDVAALAAVGIPVGLAYLHRSSRLGRWLGFFPSPAGAIEAEVSQVGCEALIRRSPLLASIESDVEALLVRSLRGGGFEAHVVPIDVCFELVATVRRHHRGFDGGDALRRAVAEIFADLERRSEAEGGGV